MFDSTCFFFTYITVGVKFLELWLIGVEYQESWDMDLNSN